MVKGNDLILEIGGVRLAASKSCAVDRQTDTIEVCSPVDGAAKKFIPSTTSWSIQANGLYANVAGAERLRAIWRAYQNGERTLLSVQYKTADGLVEEGEAILTSLQETGNVNALATFSIQLQGSGPLMKNGVPVFFAPAEPDVHIVSGDRLLFVADEDDVVDYADIAPNTSFRMVFTDVDSWAIVHGKHADWAQELSDLDGHGMIDHACVSRGVGGMSKVLPAGDYVVYACNYEMTIRAKMFAI